MVAREARRAVKVTVKSNEVKKLQHEKINVTAQKSYRFTASLKTENVSGLGAYVVVSWQKGAGTIIQEDVVTPKLVGTTDWKEYSRILTPPIGAQYFRLSIKTEKGAGTVYFDDVQVVDVTDVGM